MNDQVDQNPVPTDSRPSKRINTTALDEAHIALLRQDMKLPLRIDLAKYDWYRQHGVSRAALDRAVDIMHQRGEAELTNDGTHVWVRLLECK